MLLKVSKVRSEAKMPSRSNPSDAEKTDAGNKAAGTRVRKAAQEATVLLRELHKQVLETRSSD
jgi:hypothetical protein